MPDPLKALTDAGVSIWLDDLSREMITSGRLAELTREHHVVGVTTNPSIFAAAIETDNQYAAQLNGLAARGVGVGESLRALTTWDVRAACDVLRPVYDATDGHDGYVSIEVDPHLSHDTVATTAEARALWWTVDRPNLFVKIAATRPGLEAMARCLADGININATLIFATSRYEQVLAAFLDGLERADRDGRDLHRLSSVASVFVSRVDRQVDARLNRIGSPMAKVLRGRAAIANARLAYYRHQDMLTSARWQALAAAGARAPRPLWASMSVKDPSYLDTKYVVGLVAPDVVMTMPQSTLHAVADHGVVRKHAIRGSREQAGDVVDRLTRFGINYDDIVDRLERDGIAQFEASWNEVTDRLHRSTALAGTISADGAATSADSGTDSGDIRATATAQLAGSGASAARV